MERIDLVREVISVLATSTGCISTGFARHNQRHYGAKRRSQQCPPRILRPPRHLCSVFPEVKVATLSWPHDGMLRLAAHEEGCRVGAELQHVAVELGLDTYHRALLPRPSPPSATQDSLVLNNAFLKIGFARSVSSYKRFPYTIVIPHLSC
jgi:hypothetical protein